MRDETKCLHAGYVPQNAESRVMPIVQSTTYVYDSTEEVAAVCYTVRDASCKCESIRNFCANIKYG